MKKTITLILAVVILALLIVVVKFMPKNLGDQSLPTDAAASTAEEEKLEVINLAAADLKTVTICDGTNTVTYLPPSTENGDWIIKDHADFKSSAQTLNYRLKQAISVFATQKLSPTELSEYGLDQPLKTVTYELKDGSTKRLLIGNATLDNTNVYALAESDPTTVYIISKAYDNCIIADLSTFSDSTLSDFNADDFAVLSMNFSGRDFSPIDIHLGSNQNGILASYNFTTDEYNEVPASPGATEAIKAAFPSFKKIENYVASGASAFSEYGLDNPSFHMVINYTVQDDTKEADTDANTVIETLDLTFGNPLEGSQVAFIVGDNKDNIYSMDGSFIEKIKALITPFALCNKFIAIPSISDVKAVDISFAETNQSYHLDVDQANETYSCNDVNVDSSNFKILYRSLIGVSADKQIEEASADQTPLITLSYTLKDDTKIDAIFTASTINQYYETTLYDKLTVGCSKQQFTKLMENLEHAVKGEKIPNNL